MAQCSGALITKDTILTSAHCLISDDEEAVKEEARKLSNVGLSMMCYTSGKAERICLGERQLSGRMGKLLYLFCQTASCAR